MRRWIVTGAGKELSDQVITTLRMSNLNPGSLALYLKFRNKKTAKTICFRGYYVEDLVKV